MYVFLFRIRVICYKIATNTYFVNFILCLIIISSILLAAEDPLNASAKRNEVRLLCDYSSKYQFSLLVVIELFFVMLWECIVYQVGFSKLISFVLLTTCLLDSVLILQWEIRSSLFAAISVEGGKVASPLALVRDDKNHPFATYTRNLNGRPGAGKDLNRPYAYSQSRTGTSLKLKLMRGVISNMSLTCKLVPVHNREYEYGLA